MERRISQFGPLHKVDNEFAEFGSVPENASGSVCGDGAMAQHYEPVKYISNYYSSLHRSIDAIQAGRIRLYNEKLLKRYYGHQKLMNYDHLRNDSTATNTDGTTTNMGSTGLQTDRAALQTERPAARFFVDNFLNVPGESVFDYYEHFSPNYEKPESFPTDVNDNERNNSFFAQDLQKSPALNVYYKYYQRLVTADPRDLDILKRHHLWMPLLSTYVEKPLFPDKDTADTYANKNCPLFIQSTGYIPHQYDKHEESTMIPSIFSDFKLPALVYHCSVVSDNKIYMLGGLMACYRYNNEAPSLNDFEVKGIENLPPPLISDVINNPSMVENPYLYMFCPSSSRVTKPQISGAIPPALMSMRGSRLTDRYLFFYGGFEIKNETTVQPNGTISIEKSAFLNNTGYILDTFTFKFIKIDIFAQPYKLVSYPTLSARFGHVQVSLGSYTGNEQQTKQERSLASLESQSEQNDIANNRDSNTRNGDGTESDSSLNYSSPSPSLKGNVKSYTGKTYQKNIFTVLIFGGYKQRNDDSFEAVNDMWRIEIPVISRGKVGFYKFSDTAIATIIPDNADPAKWPSARGYAAFCLPSHSLNNNNSSNQDLLKNIDNKFEIKTTDSKVIGKHGQWTNVQSSSNDSKSGEMSSASKERLTHGVNHETSHYSLESYMIQNQYSGRANSHDTFGSLNYKTLVIHGGSNRNQVCGDMWWFDLEQEKWELIPTFANTENENEGMVEVPISLVGHSLCTVGTMLVCVGGLSLSAVRTIYFKTPVDTEQALKILKRKYVGSTMLNIIDLKTQCLQGYTVTKTIDAITNETEFILNEANDPRDRLLEIVGSTALQVNGSIILVGGLIKKRETLDNFQLRGAILQCVLPSVSLSS